MDIYCTVEERYIQAVEEIHYGETAKALRLLNELILADPDYARAYYQIGIVNYHYIQDYQAAGYYFSRTIELDQSFPEVYQEFLKLLVFLNMPKKAHQIATAALAVAGADFSLVYHQLGMLEEKNRRWQQALDHYRKAETHVFEKEDAEILKEAIARVRGKVKQEAKFVYSGNL